jgi:GNAT superfamily N-acetyltransferase
VESMLRSGVSRNRPAAASPLATSPPTRALFRSDGMFSATIWDVAVAPAWQRSGLGRAMMERLTRGLVEDGIPQITLYAEPQVRRRVDAERAGWLDKVPICPPSLSLSSPCTVH